MASGWKPTKVIEDALTRGVCFDVGHGAGSFDQYVAGAVIRLVFRDFSISTDAYQKLRLRRTQSASCNEQVYGIRHVTAGGHKKRYINSCQQLGIKRCGNLFKNATLFRVRPVNQQDTPFIDANHISIPVNMVIEPVAIILNGEFQTLNRGVFQESVSFGC